MKKFYISTAIAYANATPHMGHALELTIADVIARYKRLKGYDTFYLTGTDEHGSKIYNAARKAGIDTQEFIDKNVEKFLNLNKKLNISNNDFIRTTDKERHIPACKKLWKILKDNGDIYKKEYEGLYCEGCEAFLAKKDLLNDECPTHHKKPNIIKEENYFFKLSKYSDKILNLIESNELKITPSNRKAEIITLLKEGLHDISFSRSKKAVKWGIEIEEDNEQVMYVWSDALVNYISALGYNENSEKFKLYWPADLHVIGKDISRFHAGIWIAMLLSANIKLPKEILIHGFISHNGEKMSKSLGNVIDPIEIINAYGTDALRYYLIREIPNSRDGDFNDKIFIERYNSDLANNLGNLLNRVHTLISKNDINNFNFHQNHEIYKKKVENTWLKFNEEMEKYNLHEAIFHIWRLISFANKNIDEEKPWSLVKNAPEKATSILSNLLELLRHISIMIQIIMPMTSNKIRMQLGLNIEINFEKEKNWGALEGEWNQINKSNIIFPRIES